MTDVRLEEATLDIREAVTRNVTYLNSACKKPNYPLGALDWRVNPNLQQREVTVTDYRRRRQEARLSTTGFELFDHRSDVTDFKSEAQLSRIYIPEIKALISSITGAKKLYATPAVLRLSERRRCGDGPTLCQTVLPVRFVHADYVREDFHKFARMHLEEEMAESGDKSEAEHWLAGRYAAFNIWRAVSPPPHDCPLGFIDRRTVAPIDIVEGVAADFGTVFYTWNSHHSWGYFSDMTREEVVIFLNFDSADDALPGPPHSAFDDPTCPLNATPRLSCEIHIYAYWG